MTASYLRRKSFTVKEYYQLAKVGILKPTDRVELINGDIITMSPIKSQHAGVVNILNELLFVKLYKKATVIIQNPVTINSFSEPEPDITIAKYRKDGYSKQHPTAKDIYLIIEVSDTTLKKDREVKAELYAKSEIPEYWIVNLVNKQIEIHRNPREGEYHFKQIISKNEIVDCLIIPFTFTYEEVFI